MSMLKKSLFGVSSALVVGGMVAASPVPAFAQAANPCAPRGSGTTRANPCAAKANPCAAKANPCAAKANPCAAKANPCAAKK